MKLPKTVVIGASVACAGISIWWAAKKYNEFQTESRQNRKSLAIKKSYVKLVHEDKTVTAPASKEYAKTKEESRNETAKEYAEESKEPKIKSMESKVECTEPKIESKEPNVEFTEPKAVSTEPKVGSTELKDESKERKLESSEPKIVSTEPQVESTERKIESTEPKDEPTEPKVESSKPTDEPKVETEPKFESTEPKDESTERKVQSKEPKVESEEVLAENKRQKRNSWFTYKAPNYSKYWEQRYKRQPYRKSNLGLSLGKVLKEGPPEWMKAEPDCYKYWNQRYRIFEKFDEGILLDREAWFSTTIEETAKQIAERCRCGLVIDGFCGAGGNTIQLAMVCERVIAIDIDPSKIAMARNNAAVYGVEDRIKFIVGDFFELSRSLQADVVFMSPPWGGPEYLNQKVFDFRTMPVDLFVAVKRAMRITNNIAIFLPRNSDRNQIRKLAYGSDYEIDENWLGAKLKTITVYLGDLTKYHRNYL